MEGTVVGIGRAGAEPPARDVLDACGCLVTPELINSHHRLHENLCRAFGPLANDVGCLLWPDGRLCRARLEETLSPHEAVARSLHEVADPVTLGVAVPHGAASAALG